MTLEKHPQTQNKIKEMVVCWKDTSWTGSTATSPIISHLLVEQGDGYTRIFQVLSSNCKLFKPLAKYQRTKDW